MAVNLTAKEEVSQGLLFEVSGSTSTCPTAADTTSKGNLTSRGWPADMETVTAAVHHDQLTVPKGRMATQTQATPEESLCSLRLPS